MPLNPQEVYEKYRLAGISWANLDGDASRLEEMRKSTRSQIMISFGDMSVNKAEMLAEANQSYIDHVEKMVAARTAANIARAEWEAIKVWVDVTRSLESSRRAEMQIR